MSDDLKFETDLDHAPETVWRALEEPALRDAWLAPHDAPGTPIAVEVLEADPPNRLKVSWRGADGTLNSQVVFDIARTDFGSRLRIIHSGLRPANDANPLKMAA